MRSARRGEHTSGAEVVNASKHGFWLLVGEREYFVPFAEFPWFADAPLRDLFAVEHASPGHLHWPKLDVDLALDSIEHPERVPLISKVRERPPPRPSASNATIELSRRARTTGTSR
jgi:hypothetical protein